MTKLLEIKNLRTSFKIGGEYYAAVDNVALDVYSNEVFALVGESGSGKSAMALSVTGLHNSHFTKVAGEVIFNGSNLLTLSESALNDVRGSEIGMIFQDSLLALNPLMPIGAQIEESLFHHSSMNKAARKNIALKLLDEVGIPQRVYSQLPHELSGGMRQRVMIAIAVACKPRLIIADEPTTALDVTIQAAILELLRKIQSGTGASVILITHDLGVVAEIADRVGVMYAGQIVEVANVNDLFNNARHPYTRALLASMASFQPIPGMVPPLQDMPRMGCRFAKRAVGIPSHAHEDVPTYHQVAPGHYVLCSCYKW